MLDWLDWLTLNRMDISSDPRQVTASTPHIVTCLEQGNVLLEDVGCEGEQPVLGGKLMNGYHSQGIWKYHLECGEWQTLRLAVCCLRLLAVHSSGLQGVEWMDGLAHFKQAGYQL